LGVSLAFGSAVNTLVRKAFWISISGLISVGIIATFSRSGFLSVCFVLGLYLIIKKHKAFLPMLVILFSFGILITFNPKIVERIWGIPETIAGGAHHRFDQYAYAIEMFGESPIWGCGTGAYINRHVDEGLHNTFLLVTVETGIIGLITFGLVIWLSVKNYFNSKYFYRLRGFDGGSDFVLTSLLGLAGMLAMISTVPFREFKLLWFECGTCLLLWSLTQRFGNEYEKPLFRP
jgi:O-antigen ligase